MVSIIETEEEKCLDLDNSSHFIATTTEIPNPVE
jgi:hypothetical protein